MARPGSRQYFRESLRSRGLSPRPGSRSSRATSATGNSRHDVRRHKADKELNAIHKRIVRETERRMKELYEEQYNCPGGYSDDRLFHEWRAETNWHRKMHGDKRYDPSIPEPFASPRVPEPFSSSRPSSRPSSPRTFSPRRTRFEYEGVGRGGQMTDDDSDDDDIQAVLEAARLRREESMRPPEERGAKDSKASPAVPQTRDRAFATSRSPTRNADWHAFATSKEPITVDTVPWLKRSGPRLGIEALGVDAKAPYNIKKRAVREAVLCWHPDKWTQQFAERLSAGGDRERVMERVTAQARDVHDLFRALKEEGLRVKSSFCGAG